MDVKDAILSRRTIFKFKQGPVPNDVIEQICTCHEIWLIFSDRYFIINIKGKSYFGEKQ